MVRSGQGLLSRGLAAGLKYQQRALASRSKATELLEQFEQCLEAALPASSERGSALLVPYTFEIDRSS